jgi:hypothetical protein
MYRAMGIGRKGCGCFDPIRREMREEYRAAQSAATNATTIRMMRQKTVLMSIIYGIMAALKHQFE